MKTYEILLSGPLWSRPLEEVRCVRLGRAAGGPGSVKAGKDEEGRWAGGTLGMSNTGHTTEGLRSQEALGPDAAIQPYSKAGLR